MTTHNCGALMLLLISALILSETSYAQSQVGSLAWHPVAEALDKAHTSFTADCPRNQCGPATSKEHLKRLADYAAARDLLLGYISSQDSILQPATRVRLTFRLGQMYDGTEQYDQAVATYERCISDGASATTQFPDGLAAAPLRPQCQQALLEARSHLALARIMNVLTGRTGKTAIQF